MCHHHQSLKVWNWVGRNQGSLSFPRKCGGDNRIGEEEETGCRHCDCHTRIRFGEGNKLKGAERRTGKKKIASDPMPRLLKQSSRESISQC